MQALQHSGRQLALPRRRVRSRWSSCAPRQWIKDNGEPRLFGGGEKTSEVRGSCIRTPTPGRRLPDSQCHPTRRCRGVAALDLLRGWWPILCGRLSGTSALGSVVRAHPPDGGCAAFWTQECARLHGGSQCTGEASCKAQSKGSMLVNRCE
ncbi:hypothetical protein MTO96_011992 [Rhipicephalus appendiculatus]